MKAKRIVIAVAVLVLVLAMACALVSCDLFGGGGSGGGDDTPTYFVNAYSNNNSAGNITGYGEYKKGDTVTLTATVNQGYVFVGWQNDSHELISTDTVYSFIMGDEDMYFAGIFYDCRQVKLECDWSQGSVSGDDFYDVGSSVTISATANIGYIFAGWYDGDTLISSEPTYTFIKDEKYTAYTAKFNVEQVYEKLKLKRLDDGTYELVEITDKSITEIVLPSYISHIGTGAFRDCNILVSVTIPDSVRSIGSSAFKGCNTLTSISIPDSVTIIGSYAFEGCTGLTSVTIPDNIREFHLSPFKGCNSITSITVPASYVFRYIFGASEDSKYLSESLKKVVITGGESIDNNVFKGYSSLTSVTIPDSVTSIGSSAFYGCSSLTSITLPYCGKFGYIFGASHNSENSEYVPESLKKVIITSGESIGDYAFYNCTDLTSITIPNSVTSIGKSAFEGCSGLTSVTIGNGVSSIGSYAFYGCSKLTSVTIPDSVTSIGNGAFSGCSGLTSVTIPDSVTNIGNSTFKNCNSLTGITIPDSVTSIGDDALSGCSSLTSVTIGNSVTSIGDDAFYNCSKISEVKYTGTIAQWCAISGLDALTSLTKIKLYIGGNEITGNLVIPDGVTSIGSSAFYNCSNLTSVTIPDSVTSIGEAAFNNRSNISEVKFNGTIEQWLNISGLGNLMSYGSNKKLYIGGSEITDLIIPDSVTSIGNSAFRGCSSLTSITIPNSVTSIGEAAFYNCSSISEVKYNGTIEQWLNISGLGNLMSYGSNKKLYIGGNELTELVIPDSVTSIASYAFYKCIDLTSVTMGNSVTSIGWGTFGGCSGLTSITLPFVGAKLGGTENTYFGYIFGASSGSYNSDHVPESLKEVIITSGESIGDWAFRGCSSLTSITIPDSVTSIGEAAFYNCSNISEVKYNGTIEQWLNISGLGNLMYYGSYKKLYIDGSELTELVIPNSVTSIGEYAFSGCSGLTSVTIPNSVTSIGNSAFRGCSGLTSVTIGNSVTSIGDWAFYNCSNISEVKYNGTIEQWLNISGLGNLMYYSSNKKLYIGGSELIDLVIPNSVTSIASYAFYKCIDLTSVTMGNSVTSIGNSAFYNCRSLTSVTIGNSVTSIGNSAFSGCNSLTSVSIGNSVTSIGNSAFSGCNSLTSVSIGNSVTSIGERAFSGCSGLTSITLPFVGAKLGGTKNTHFGYIFGASEYSENVGYVPKSLKEVIISGGKSIGDSAFYNCSSLTSVTIPDSVTSIGFRAFTDCSSLTSVTIPDSVTSIGNYAFWDCSSLTSVTIGNSVTSIGEGVFSGCSRLTSITIGCSITSISDWAFSGCSKISEVKYNGTIEQWCAIDGLYNLMGYGSIKKLYLGGNELTELVISNSVASIGDGAFYNCSSLTSITIPNSVTSIGIYAFYGCSNISEVKYNGTIEQWLNISGLGNLMQYASNKKLYIGGNELTKLVIPEGVTSIGDDAFRGCSGLTSVTIPDSVASIGSSAFYNCNALAEVYNLSSLNITKGSNSYGNVAYYAHDVYTSILEPSKLTEKDGMILHKDGNNVTLVRYIGDATNLTIPNSVTRIGYSAFEGCSGLTSITLPFVGAEFGGISNTHFGYIFGASNYSENANYVPKSLKEVIITGGKSIGEYAFRYCSGLTSVTIPDSVTSIGSYAFYGCSSLTSVTIGRGVTSIGERAFYSCYALAEVYNLSNLKITKGSWNNGYVAYYAYDVYTSISAPSKLTEKDGMILHIDGKNVTLVRYIGDAISVIIPGNVTSIGNYAFFGCRSLTSVTIGNSVKSIGDNAFMYCRSLTSVTIPDSVTSIGTEAFYGCSSLTSVTIGNSVTSIDSYAFSGCYALAEVYNLSSLNITKGSNSYGNVAYYAHDVYTSILETSKLTEKYGMILHTDGNNVTLVRYIGDATSVTIPNSVTSIGKYAFEDCSSLTSITIPDSVTSIGKYAFEDCSSLTSITIPDSVTSIGNGAFSGCFALAEVYNLSSLNITKGSSDYGHVAYYAYDVYTSLSKPSKLTEKDGMILHIDGKNVTLVRYIGDAISVIIPDNVTSIGSYAFYYCSGLTSVIIPDSVTSIGYSAFEGCGNLTSVTIPDSVTSIGNYAFSGCSSLTSVTIGNSVTIIGRSAFYNCRSLTSVTFENTTGWFVSESSNDTSGTNVDVTSPSQNAKNLTDTYKSYSWKRK